MDVQPGAMACRLDPKTQGDTWQVRSLVASYANPGASPPSPPPGASESARGHRVQTDHRRPSHLDSRPQWCICMTTSSSQPP